MNIEHKRNCNCLLIHWISFVGVCGASGVVCAVLVGVATRPTERTYTVFVNETISAVHFS